ncbi:MAG: PAS domain S-box protein [Xanthobacteraceae bacterium]|nr:PAS domain S-box protein [Xanthobacteraceae bacterium]
MELLKILRDHLDTLLHPSVRDDALASARHRAFIALRLLGGLIALAVIPLYLAVRGAPSLIEVLFVGWLITPISIAYFLSRTGKYEVAHSLSSISLAAMVTAVAAFTGGVSSFAAIGLIAVPMEAALSESRRVVSFALALALGCTLILVGIENMDALPITHVPPGSAKAFFGLGAVAAIIYAAIFAYCAEAFARTSRHLLKQEEQRYRMLARNISDVISRHQPNGDVNFVSPAADGLLGAPGSLLLGHGLFDRVHVADRPGYLTALSDAARGGESRSIEFRVRRDNPRTGTGEFVWVEMRCCPLDMDARNPANASEVVAVMRDVTERKAQEQALDIARQEAERASASKSQFLATMSHELRTPLNAIIGFSEMMSREEEMKLDSARRKEYASLINESGNHLLSVVNGILDVSKMESGTFEIAPELFAPRAALVSCCNLMALKAREKGVDLVTRLPQDLPSMTGDPLAFKQILLNLLSNAIKFTERGGSVTVSSTVEGRNMIVRVADTGVGIGESDLAQLGRPFFQAGGTYQGRHEGTGLGLSIVMSLVALHGGEMKVQSKLDHGTTISVSLPLTFTAPVQPNNIRTLTPASRADAGEVKVKKIA